MKKVIIILILLISAAVFALMYAKEKKLEARRAAVLLYDQQQAGNAVFEQIMKYEQRLSSIVEQGEPYVERAGAVVLDVTGRPLKEEPAAKPRQPVLVESAAVRERVEPQPAAAAQSKERVPDPPAPREEDFSSWDGEGVPPGMMSREQLEAMRRRRAKQEPEPVKETAAPEEVDVEAPSVVPERKPIVFEREPDNSPVVKRALDMREKMQGLVQLRNDMADLVYKASGLRNDLARAPVAAVAAPIVAALKEEAGFAEAKIMDANSLIEDMQRIETDLLQLQRQAERERLAREEAEQAQRAAEQHKALVRSEKERIKGTHENTKPLIKKYDFSAALETVDLLMSNLETEEAREVLGVIKERYELLQGFKEYLTEQINARPYRWGWVQDVGQMDVLKADAEGIKTTKRNVAWEEIQLPQLLRILNFYIGQTDARTRDQGDGCLAAAILCYETGNTEFMDRYRDKALHYAPYLADKAQRLLP